MITDRARFASPARRLIAATAGLASTFGVRRRCYGMKLLTQASVSGTSTLAE